MHPGSTSPGPPAGSAVVPSRYELWADGVYHVDFGLSEAPIVPSILVALPLESRSGRERITHRPVWVSAIGVTVDTREPLVKLAFVNLNGTIDELWVDRGQITETKLLVTLGAVGVPVDSLSARKVLAYLRDAEHAAAQLGSIIPVGSRSGPYQWGARWGFLIGDRWIGPGRLEPDPRKRSRQAAACHPYGSWEMWRERWRELYYMSWVTRWVIACGFAAPLLRHIGCRTFMVHQWGQSGAGKTAASVFALSAWGNPELLYSSQNTTQIAVTEIFKHVTDLPVLYDEKQVATVTSEELIYSVCGTRGRERGSKFGGLRQDNVQWNTLALSTGEVPLVTSRDLGGQLNRVLQIHSAAFAQKSDAEAVYHFTRQHYGHAGPIYIELLLEILNSEAGVQHLRTSYTEIRAEISARSGHDGNHAAYAAAIALAQWTSAVWLLGIPQDEARTTAIEDGLRALVETWPVHAPSYAERALALLRDHWIQNPLLYADDSGDLQPDDAERKHARMQYMVGVERPECMIYVPQGANQILTEAELEPERVWRDFGALGWLVISPRGGLLTFASLRGDKSPNHPVYAIDGRVFYTDTHMPRSELRVVAGGKS